LIGRPGHPETKPLRKNESIADSSGANKRTNCSLFAVLLRITTDTAADSRGRPQTSVCRLHQWLTIIGKDCARTGQRAQGWLVQTEADTHSTSLQTAPHGRRHRRMAWR
jgi:hypothetical protein